MQRTDETRQVASRDWLAAGSNIDEFNGKTKRTKGIGSQTANAGLLASMFQAGLYKPLQGRVVRQVTFVAFAVLALLIAWEIPSTLACSLESTGVTYTLGLVLSVIGVWIAYRMVNYPAFADFLIAVEAEMNKVSWPTWPELWKASLVVIFVIFSMALSLWVFDLVWAYVFWLIGIR